MNVTIPYKESVIPFLTKLDPTAAAIGAVNTIKFTEEGTIGYNTDVIGFKNAIEPLIMPHHKKALILGTGGASLCCCCSLSRVYFYATDWACSASLRYSQVTLQAPSVSYLHKLVVVRSLICLYQPQLYVVVLVGPALLLLFH